MSVFTPTRTDPRISQSKHVIRRIRVSRDHHDAIITPQEETRISYSLFMFIGEVMH